MSNQSLKRAPMSPSREKAHIRSARPRPKPRLLATPKGKAGRASVGRPTRPERRPEPLEDPSRRCDGVDDLKTLRGYEAADLEAISAYGYRLYQYGRFLDAEVVFDGLLAVDPGNAYAAQALAAVRLQLGDYDGALKALNHSIVRHPRAFVPYVLRAQCMMALGHLKRAVSDLDRAEKLGRRVSREAPEWTMVEALRERLALG